MGALTSKPYAFSARPWELSDVFAVDFLDTLHAPLRLSTRGGELLRVLPDLRYSSLNEWISDRSRFSYDSVSCNRIKYFNFSFRARLSSYSVSKSYLLNFLLVRSYSFSGPAFDFFSFDQILFSARALTRSGLQLVDSGVDFRSSYTLGSQLISSTTLGRKALFVVGLSVRYTHPVLFARLKQLKKSGTGVFSFGEVLSGFDYSFGSSLKNFFNFFRFKLRSGMLADNAIFISSLRLAQAFPHFFSPASTLALSESPVSALFGEVAFRPHFFSKITPRYNITFSPYMLKTVGFVVPVAHFYESNFTVLSGLSAERVRSEPSLSSSHSVYDFFSAISHELQQPSSFASFSNSLQLVTPVPALHTNVYSSYNYYDHFFGHASLRNSTNILLNLRRNEDYRHTHFCSF